MKQCRTVKGKVWAYDYAYMTKGSKQTIDVQSFGHQFRAIRLQAAKLYRWKQGVYAALFTLFLLTPAACLSGTVYTDAVIAVMAIASFLLWHATRAQHSLFDRASEASAELHKLSNLMTGLLDHVPVPLFVKDAQSLRIIFWNFCMEELTEIKRGEILDTNGYESFPIEEMERYLNDDLEALSSQCLIDVEESITCPSGKRLLLNTKKVPIVDDDGQAAYLLGITENITEKKKHAEEEALKRKLQAVGTLASGIAHELNTPLQYVSLNLHYLKTFLEESSTQGANDTNRKRLNALEAVEQSQQGVDQAIEIICAMRDFGANSNTPHEKCDIRRILHNAILITTPRWKHVAEIETSFSEEVHMIYARHPELLQAFMNLIVNAADAIEERRPEGGGVISIVAQDQGESVQIQIRDNGIGILPHNQEHIFDPFFTTKEVGRGTGQGLSICRSIIVDKHHGQIAFESNPGEGTTFTISFPLKGEDNDETQMCIH